MQGSLTDLVEQARKALAEAQDTAALANAKARFLGREGALTARMKALSSLSGENKAAAGRELNSAKQAIEALVNDREVQLAQAQLDARLAQEAIDVTLPGRGMGREVFIP